MAQHVLLQLSYEIDDQLLALNVHDVAQNRCARVLSLFVGQLQLLRPGASGGHFSLQLVHVVL